jgi:hypothetical protein
LDLFVAKSYYRVRLGEGGKNAEECLANGFVGTDFGIRQDLTSKLPEDWRSNREFIPVMLEAEPNKSKVVAAPEAAPACAVIGAAAFAASATRSAVESGIVGSRPTNYCRFALSLGASSTLYGTGTAISQLWREPYVLSEVDRRVLRSSTEFLTGGTDVITGAGAAGLCATSGGGIGSPEK